MSYNVAKVTLHHKQQYDDPEGMVLYNYNMLKLWTQSMRRLEHDPDFSIEFTISIHSYSCDLKVEITRKNRTMYEQFMNNLASTVLCHSAKYVLENREHFTKIINEMLLQMLDINKIVSDED